MSLILRREAFGGLLFSTNNAVHIELDSEGFALVENALINKNLPRCGYAFTFMQQIQQQIPDVFDAPITRVCLHKNTNNSALEVFASPSLVDFQITTQCFEACPHCYANAAHLGTHVPLEHAILAINSFAEAGVCQIALGGGEPLLHPQLEIILQKIVELGMVPNLTTNGSSVNNDNIKFLKKYCGAVALSLEGTEERFGARRKMGFALFKEKVAMLLQANIPLVFQVTLDGGNINYLPEIVEFAVQYPLYGVIFLAYKPVGRGVEFAQPLSAMSAAKARGFLRQAFVRLSRSMRVGYDCCLAPLLVNLIPDHDDAGWEGCSATRGSVGVTTNLEVVPCTFLTNKPLGNLHNNSLINIWQSNNTNAFRDNFSSKFANTPLCQTCNEGKRCLGGCPVMNLVGCYRE